MEKEAPNLNSNVNIEIPFESDTLKLVDNLEISDSFKKQLLTPYLASLWESLASRSWSPDQGLSRFAFTEVGFIHNQYIVR